jgi:hypothetical protein
MMPSKIPQTPIWTCLELKMQLQLLKRLQLLLRLLKPQRKLRKPLPIMLNSQLIQQTPPTSCWQLVAQATLLLLATPQHPVPKQVMP